MTRFLNRWHKNSLIALLLVALYWSLSVAVWTPASNAALPAGNAITDGKALLRYALPLDSQNVRKLQQSLEDIATQLRANRRWSAVSSDLNTASKMVNDPAKLLASVPLERQSQAQDLISQIKDSITDLRQAVDAKDKENTWQGRAKVLNLVGQL